MIHFSEKFINYALNDRNMMKIEVYKQSSFKTFYRVHYNDPRFFISLLVAIPFRKREVQ